MSYQNVSGDSVALHCRAAQLVKDLASCWQGWMSAGKWHLFHLGKILGVNMNEQAKTS